MAWCSIRLLYHYIILFIELPVLMFVFHRSRESYIYILATEEDGSTWNQVTDIVRMSVHLRRRATVCVGS